MLSSGDCFVSCIASICDDPIPFNTQDPCRRQWATMLRSRGDRGMAEWTLRLAEQKFGDLCGRGAALGGAE